MKTIKHYMLPEQTNELYKKEASSSISLTRDVADKINELIDAYNELSKGNLAKEQDGRIAKAILFMKDNLLNSLHDLFETLKASGDFASILSGSVYEKYNELYNSLSSVVNVKNYGAKGDGKTDDTYSIKKAIAAAKLAGKCTVFFPKGVYCFTDLGNLAIEGIAFSGEFGYKATVLKCINTADNHVALKFDAFENSTKETQFCYGVSVRNIHILGNQKTDACLLIRGCVHSVFENIYAGECKRVVFDIQGVMASAFYNMNTINRNYKAVENKALFGALIDTAYRGGESVGASTNDTFINCYFEDCHTGAKLVHADQATFTGCAFEYNEEVGLQLENNARMTLINGCGIENNPTSDYIDNGRLTKMMNSYVQYVATVGGANCTIENSLIDSIVVSGLNNEVKNVRLKYHSYSDDGEAFTDNGIGTIVQNIFNIKAAKNIFPTKKRKSFTVPAGGLEYKNETNHIVEVYCQAGTIATVQMKRDGENWLALNPSVPAKWILRPDDTINITYSDTPALSYIETYER